MSGSDSERPTFLQTQVERHQSFFPLEERVTINGRSIHYTEVVRFLEAFLTDERKERIQEIVKKRSYHIVPVLDHIFDEGNISAVWRCADNFGLQAAHVVRSEKTKKMRSVARGSENWLDIFHWSDTTACLKHLKKIGYKIVATVLHPKARTIEQLDINTPMCLVFGNEKMGVSDEVLKMADEWCLIPTVGFSQSLNISVAAGIFFHTLHQKRIAASAGHEYLSLEQQEILKAEFYIRSVHTAKLLLEHYLDLQPLKQSQPSYFEYFSSQEM